MPRDIEQFVPWRVLWYCYQQLLTVQRAHGFNCDADVYMDATEYQQSAAKSAVLIFSEEEGADDQQMGGGHGSPRLNERTGITILGSVKYDVDIPTRAQMALEQDVRTALQQSVDGMRSLVGVGVSFRWGECQRYVVGLTGEREAGFRLTCSVTYPQGSNW